MLRSKNNLRNAVVKRKQGGHSPPQSGKKMRPLDVEESAKRANIEVVKIGSFPDEWLSLKETKKVKKASHDQTRSSSYRGSCVLVAAYKTPHSKTR